MTLLVLDLHTPVRDAVPTEHDLTQILLLLLPQIVSYLLSFMTIGIFWNGQQAQQINSSTVIGT